MIEMLYKEPDHVTNLTAGILRTPRFIFSLNKRHKIPSSGREPSAGLDHEASHSVHSYNLKVLLNP